jgi:hypothetical protein
VNEKNLFVIPSSFEPQSGENDRGIRCPPEAATILAGASPRPLPLMLILVLTRNVWNGHSCPLPLKLILISPAP